MVKLEIGPLGDFSQLVGFEDASASSAPRRSRSNASPRAARPSRCDLDEPIELLRELEELSALDFKVRHTAPDNLILDVDEDQGPSSAPPSARRTRDKLGALPGL